MRKAVIFIVLFPLLSTITHGKGAATAVAEAKKEPTLSLTEEWIQNSRHSISWLKWGADLRLREEYYSNAKQNSENPDRETNQQRARMRLWTEITPWESFTFRVRAMSEPRTYIKPDSKQGYVGELILDNLSVTLSPEKPPLQALIGRQELSDLEVPWLLRDGTPTDTSRTSFFDAARLTYTSVDEKTSVHGIFLYQDERSDAWLPPVGMQPSLKYLSEEDIVSGMFLIRNKSPKNTTLEGLVIYKHEFESDQSLGTTGDTVTICPKVGYKIDDHWEFEAEAAGQFGRRGDHSGNNMRDVIASGALSRLQYHFQDELKNTARLGVEYLSGRGKNSET
ncbi:MAG TPA: alginate export family protein, partial [Verrucomicrobiota bacterium]|nr:alginate export family protein [Verrucomicrobiota bacterium]